MKATIYKTTTQPPVFKKWGASFPNSYYGMGYEADINDRKLFLHIFLDQTNGMDIQLERTVTYFQSTLNTYTLKTWRKGMFDPSNIKLLYNDIGTVKESVWRPGIGFNDDIPKALSFSETQRHASEQTLRMFINKLEEILLYIEPSKAGLNAYSHKTREFLILLCTEFENNLVRYMEIAKAKSKNKHYTMKDYIALCKPLFLTEYEIIIKPYIDIIAPIKPFKAWGSNKPLTWYTAYNKAKHDRTKEFHMATLNNCLQALAANIILFCVRYSPYYLIATNSLLSTTIRQLFEIRLVNPNLKSFYIPKLLFSEPPNLIAIVNGYRLIQPWKIEPLLI